MFAAFKKADRYFDLCIQVNDISIKVHKALICEKSGLIEMLVRRAQVDDWPPIHTITMQLPDNISLTAFVDTINYLYDESPTDIMATVNTLFYLSVDVRVIMSLIKKRLPTDSQLKSDYVELINQLIDHYGITDESPILPLITFYGKDLAPLISAEPLLFGHDVTDIEKIYSIRAKHSYRLPDYVEAKERKYMYIYSLNVDKRFEFEAFGVNWVLMRHIHSFSYGDNEDLIKIYARDTVSKEVLSIRAIFIIYSLNDLPTIEIGADKEVIPSEYTSSFMIKNHKSNSLGTSLPYGCFDDDKIRISLIMERL